VGAARAGSVRAAPLQHPELLRPLRVTSGPPWVLPKPESRNTKVACELPHEMLQSWLTCLKCYRVGLQTRNTKQTPRAPPVPPGRLRATLGTGHPTPETQNSLYPSLPQGSGNGSSVTLVFKAYRRLYHSTLGQTLKMFSTASRHYTLNPGHS